MLRSIHKVNGNQGRYQKILLDQGLRSFRSQPTRRCLQLILKDIEKFIQCPPSSTLDQYCYTSPADVANTTPIKKNLICRYSISFRLPAQDQKIHYESVESVDNGEMVFWFLSKTIVLSVPFLSLKLLLMALMRCIALRLSELYYCNREMANIHLLLSLPFRR